MGIDDGTPGLGRADVTGSHVTQLALEPTDSARRRIEWKDGREKAIGPASDGQQYDKTPREPPKRFLQLLHTASRSLRGSPDTRQCTCVYRGSYDKVPWPRSRIWRSKSMMMVCYNSRYCVNSTRGGTNCNSCWILLELICSTKCKITWKGINTKRIFL